MSMGLGRDADLDLRKSPSADSDLMLLTQVSADHIGVQPGVVDLDADSHAPAGGSPTLLCLQVVPGSPEQLQLGGLPLPGAFVIPILLPGVKPVSSAHPDGGHLHLRPNKHISISTVELLSISFFNSKCLDSY